MEAVLVRLCSELVEAGPTPTLNLKNLMSLLAPEAFELLFSSIE